MPYPLKYAKVVSCASCGQEFRRRDRGRPTQDRYFCSPDCRAAGCSREGHPQWRGGRTISEHGYVKLKQRGHPNADPNGYVYEHRLVAERKFGRSLVPGEVVHHVNGDKRDNRPENISLFPSVADHLRHHRDAGPAEDIRCNCQP